MPIKSTVELGRIVTAVRHSQGLSQAELALAAGTGLRFVHDLETGKPTLRLCNVLQALQALGIELEPKRRGGEPIPALTANATSPRSGRRRSHP